MFRCISIVSPLELLGPCGVGGWERGAAEIGSLAEGVSGFRLTQEDNRIILEPLVELPAREYWLRDNGAARESIARGLEDSAAGRTKDRGSFAQYAEIDLDE